MILALEIEHAHTISDTAADDGYLSSSSSTKNHTTHTHTAHIKFHQTSWSRNWPLNRRQRNCHTRAWRVAATSANMQIEMGPHVFGFLAIRHTPCVCVPYASPCSIFGWSRADRLRVAFHRRARNGHFIEHSVWSWAVTTGRNNTPRRRKFLETFPRIPVASMLRTCGNDHLAARNKQKKTITPTKPHDNRTHRLTTQSDPLPRNMAYNIHCVCV